ncbi:MAG: hypothetical protein RR292_02125, partial [Christensenellaceae bacterium]
HTPLPKNVLFLSSTVYEVRIRASPLKEAFEKLWNGTTSLHSTHSCGRFAWIYFEDRDETSKTGKW